MNIIYFTTTQDSQDYIEFQKLWSKDINPSNQTFHNKLIRALAINNKVDVISVRPFSRKYCNVDSLEKCVKEDGNITWYYLSIPKIKSFKVQKCNSQTKKITNKLNQASLIITDTINPTVLAVSTHYAHKHKLPIIGVCTDSPSNITGTLRSYTLFCLKLAKQLDGYICLTSELNELFNDKNKKSIIIEGIVEDKLPSPIDSELDNYIFYAGTLLEKYGIYNLIEAYNSLNNFKHKLVIAGHTGNKEKLEKAINGNENIIYLGCLSNEDILRYEQKAWLNVNPRPYSMDLDRYSIPSKVLEYYDSGKPTLSVKNTKLQKLFYDSTFWCKTANPDDLKSALQYVNNLPKDIYNKFSKQAKNVVQKYYSISSIGTKLEGFLYLFIEK